LQDWNLICFLQRNKPETANIEENKHILTFELSSFKFKIERKIKLEKNKMKKNTSKYASDFK